MTLRNRARAANGTARWPDNRKLIPSLAANAPGHRAKIVVGNMAHPRDSCSSTKPVWNQDARFRTIAERENNGVPLRTRPTFCEGHWPSTISERRYPLKLCVDELRLCSVPAASTNAALISRRTALPVRGPRLPNSVPVKIMSSSSSNSSSVASGAIVDVAMRACRNGPKGIGPVHREIKRHLTVALEPPPLDVVRMHHRVKHDGRDEMRIVAFFPRVTRAKLSMLPVCERLATDRARAIGLGDNPQTNSHG